MSEEYHRGQQPGAMPPPMTDPGYGDFQRGKQHAEQNAQVYGERWGRGMDNIRDSTARAFSRGFWPAFLGWIRDLIRIPLVIGLVVGLIAYFTDHDYKRAAAIAAGIPFTLLFLWGVLIFTLYGIVRYAGVLILGALAVVGLHAVGVVPKFW
jgi:hypothetical protein